MKRLVLKKRAKRPQESRMTVAKVLGQEFFGKGQFAESEAMRRRLDGSADHDVRGLWKDLVNKDRDISEQPIWLLRLGIEYVAQCEGYVRVKGSVPDIVLRRSKLAAALDRAGLRKESDFLTDDYRDKSGGNTMAKGKVEKRKGERRGARVTASSVLIHILGLSKVPSDEAIIEQVRKETGSDKFDAKQLAWYKWKYRQGKLKGQDGKQHVIEQGDNKKAPKKDKPSRKKLVVKKKKASKE